MSRVSKFRITPTKWRNLRSHSMTSLELSKSRSNWLKWTKSAASKLRLMHEDELRRQLKRGPGKRPKNSLERRKLNVCA